MLLILPSRRALLLATKPSSNKLTMQVHSEHILTSLLRFDLQNFRGRPISHRCEAQHPQAVGDIRGEAWDDSKLAVVCVVLLPSAERGIMLWTIVHSVALDLTVGLLWWFPLHQHCAGAQHACLDVKRRWWGCLLACTSIHNTAGRPSANTIHGHDSKVIFWERAEATDAVSGCCNSVYFLEAIVRKFGTVLDDIVRHWFLVARVPGQGDTGSRGFRHNEGGRGTG